MMISSGWVDIYKNDDGSYTLIESGINMVSNDVNEMGKPALFLFNVPYEKIDEYVKQYGKVLEDLHPGFETGVFSSRIPDFVLNVP